MIQSIDTSHPSLPFKGKEHKSLPLKGDLDGCLPGLILETEKQMRRFLKSLNRQEMNKKHRKETSKEHEINNEDLEILKNSHKVQLKY